MVTRPLYLRRRTVGSTARVADFVRSLIVVAIASACSGFSAVTPPELAPIDASPIDAVNDVRAAADAAVDAGKQACPAEAFVEPIAPGPERATMAYTSIARAADGRLVVAFEPVPAPSSYVAVIAQHGDGWSAPQKLHTDTTQAMFPSAAATRDGAIHVVFADLDRQTLMHAVDTGNGFQIKAIPGLRDRRTHLATYGDSLDLLTTAGSRLLHLWYANGQWSEPEVLAEKVEPNDPAAGIAAGKSGIHVVACDQQPKLFYWSKPPGSQRFGAPQQLPHDFVDRCAAAVALDTAGSPHVIYADMPHSTSYPAQLFHVTRSGTALNKPRSIATDASLHAIQYGGIELRSGGGRMTVVYTTQDYTLAYSDAKAGSFGQPMRLNARGHAGVSATIDATANLHIAHWWLAFRQLALVRVCPE